MTFLKNAWYVAAWEDEVSSDALFDWIARTFSSFPVAAR